VSSIPKDDDSQTKDCYHNKVMKKKERINDDEKLQKQSLDYFSQTLG